MVIPEVTDIQDGKEISYHEEIISGIHNSIGHLGYKKTYQRAKQDYIWPLMSKDIKDFVLSCDSCQRNKSSTQKPAGLLHPPATPLMSGTHYSMDLIGPLPQSFFTNDYYD